MWHKDVWDFSCMEGDRWELGSVKRETPSQLTYLPTSLTVASIYPQRLETSNKPRSALSHTDRGGGESLLPGASVLSRHRTRSLAVAVQILVPLPL